jgi:DME family drug/metabolite transporter
MAMAGCPPNRFGSAMPILLGSALFGTVGTAQALGPDVPVPQLSAARLLLAALLLLVFTTATHGSQTLRLPWRAVPTLLAGVSQASFNLCFFGAMTEAGVAVGTLVAIGATPMVTGLLTRQVSRLWLVATVIAITGLVLLVGGQLATDSPPSFVGIALALAAAASYATYIVAGNAAAAQMMDTLPFLTAAFAIAAMVLSPLLFLGDVSWIATSGGMALLAYLAAGATVLAYGLFNRGLRGLRASTASTLGLIEPVVATVLAVALLNETLRPAGALGGLLVLGGLGLILRSVGANPTSTGEVVREKAICDTGRFLFQRIPSTTDPTVRPASSNRRAAP